MTTSADRFHALHAGPDVLLLPNAWDAASAALMEDAGAKAVATSSAAVAWAEGYADGDAVPVAAVIDTVAGIARVVSVPVTADIEGGYTDDLERHWPRPPRRWSAPARWGSISRTAGRDPDAARPQDRGRPGRRRARPAWTCSSTPAPTSIWPGWPRVRRPSSETLRRAALYTQDAGASGIFAAPADRGGAPGAAWPPGSPCR